METPRRPQGGAPRETTGETPGGTSHRTSQGVPGGRPVTPPPTERPYYSEPPEKFDIKRISWAAIFAGTLIMLVVMLLLSLLGMGIGLSSINPLEEAHPLSGIGTGALIWWVVSNLIAVFAGGYVAAHLTTLTYKFSGVYHGVITWSLYTLISFIMMVTVVGAVISGVGTVVTRTLGAMGTGVTELVGAAEGADFDNERINQMLQDALERDQRRAGEDAQEFDIDVMAVIQDVFFADGQIQTDVDRQDLEQAIARHSTLDQRDVSRAADVMMEQYQRVEQQYNRMMAEAERMAQEASDAAGRAAIWGFFALLIGAAAAATGGWLGKPDDFEVQNARRL